MQLEFLNFITREKLFFPSQKILLAVSGGVDSMVMCDLFLKSNWNFGVAHCNFQLRGEDSVADEEFVQNWCIKNKITFFSKKFDTKEYCRRHKIPTQEGARKLRYEWFETLLKEENFDFLAIAHHLEDSLETILLNLGRGTSFVGLRGILPKKDYKIRPLLFAYKEQIIAYAQKNDLEWREDKSNQTLDYQRNQIRDVLLPIYHQICPNLKGSLAESLERIRLADKVLAQKIDEIHQEISYKKNNQIIIDPNKLLVLNEKLFYFYELIKKFNFNYTDAKQILAKNYAVGTIFENYQYQLLIDRKYWILQKKIKKIASFIIENEYTAIKINDFTLKIEKIRKPENLILPTNEAYFDSEKLSFPILIRPYQHGDYFLPLGMKGKKQKLSDFLTNLKLSRFEKETTLVMENKNKIAWVVGKRISEDFKCDENTSFVWHFKLELL